MIVFPSLDPIAFYVGPWPVRWYGLAYLLGILGAWFYCVSLLSYFRGIEKKDLEDFVGWSMIGIVVGGRLGHVLFYDFAYYIAHPLEILMTWQGGMAFHGGVLGLLIAMIVYCRVRHLPLLSYGDIVACGAPPGLFLGRIANFLNQEAYGRVTDVPWAVMFPRGGYLPRHPSQLYEAFLEGIVLFCLLRAMLVFRRWGEKPGALSALFLLGYGVMRFGVEWVREPDFMVTSFLAIGQLLSLPLIFSGGLLLYFSFYRYAHTARN